MKLYILKFDETALMNSHGFRGRTWALCQVDTGEVWMCYETAAEAINRAIEFNQN